jgi:hypothetical protein
VLLVLLDCAMVELAFQIGGPCHVGGSASLDQPPAGPGSVPALAWSG